MKKMNISDAELLILISEVEENAMLKAPKHLKENILKQSESIKVVPQTKEKKLSYQIQLFLYGLKISAAVVVSFLLFLTVNLKNSYILPEVLFTEPAGQKVSSVINQTSDKLGNWIGEISNNMIIRRGEEK